MSRHIFNRWTSEFPKMRAQKIVVGPFNNPSVNLASFGSVVGGAQWTSDFPKMRTQKNVVGPF